MTVHGIPRRVTALACGLLLGLPTACTMGEPAPTRLSVLASSDLADMEPLLAELRRDTGIELSSAAQPTWAGM